MTMKDKMRKVITATSHDPLLNSKMTQFSDLEPLTRWLKEVCCNMTSRHLDDFPGLHQRDCAA